jgi:ATP-dependent protease ClpP protease subunit
MSLNWGDYPVSKRAKYMHNNGKEKKEKKPEKLKPKPTDDDDDDDDGGLGSLFNLAMPKSDELICREGNHIYFWDEVNTENVLKFTKMLRKVDYQQQCAVLKGDVDEARVYIHFNSPGGSLTDGFSMASSVKRCRSKTIGIVEGCVASATTLPLVVCNHRQMQRYSYFLIHQLRTGFWGTFSNLLDETETCKDMMNILSSIYLEHTKVPKKVLEGILKRELMWSSETCLKYNIVDELI